MDEVIAISEDRTMSREKINEILLRATLQTQE